MQKEKARSWTACGLFVIASIIAGCSSAGEDPASAESVHQDQEAVSTCALTAGMSSAQKAALSDGVQVTADPTKPNARTLVAPHWCACCDQLIALANRDCASYRQGWYAANAICSNACGLCGRDSAYSNISYECAPDP